MLAASYDTQSTTPQGGTVIHGTHRKQDLIPALLDAVALYNKPGYAGLTAAFFGPVPAYVYDEGDESEWWSSDEAEDLLEQLFSLLEDVAPHGTYFGAHEGDGSDFGFWELSDTN